MPGLVALVSRLIRRTNRHRLEPESEPPQLDGRQREPVEVTDAKNTFSMNMNHEILTPLNAMLGMADLLWASELSREQLECVAVVRRAGGSLSALLNDLLDIHAIESGKLVCHPADFDLTEILSTISEIAKVSARDKGLSFVTNISPRIPRLMNGDPDLLGQVLINLLANAVKFTTAGEIKLCVDCEMAETISTETIQFKVSDTGVGVPPGKLTAIFESFTQADSSITRRYGGAGSGLFIANKLVEQMGGQLRVESELGRGSVFSFEIPLKQINPNIPAPKVGAGPHILLVEDSLDNQQLVAAYLKQTAYQMEIAGNGRDGIARFISGNFDLVLMDIQMPEMDGWTATAKMREWECQQRRRPVPILALTANVTPNDFHLSRVAGCNAHLAKPITQDTLLHALKEHLTASVEVRVCLPPAVEELGPKYLRNRRTDLDTLSAALSKCDYNAIRVLGHNMKGSGGGYGFPRISDIGKRMELAAKSESNRDIETEITALSDYLNLLTPTE